MSASDDNKRDDLEAAALDLARESEVAIRRVIDAAENYVEIVERHRSEEQRSGTRAQRKPRRRKG